MRAKRGQRRAHARVVYASLFRTTIKANTLEEWEGTASTTLRNVDSAFPTTSTPDDQLQRTVTVRAGFRVCPCELIVAEKHSWSIVAKLVPAVF